MRFRLLWRARSAHAEQSVGARLRTLRGPLGWALAAAVLIAACGGTSTPVAGTGAPAASSGPRLGSFDRPIVLAFTPSQDVARVSASGNQIKASLEKATTLSWKVSIPTSYAAVIEGLCSGSIDVAFLAPLMMALATDKGCATPFLGALRKDEKGQLSTTYQSQIVVRTDSGINDIAGLKGKKFGFTDSVSTSGYLFPTLKVKEITGQDPKTFFSNTTFTGGHDKAMLAVYQGTVDAAASFIDARTLKGMPADIMQKTKVIATAGPIPNDGAAVRKGFPADLTQQIQKSLEDYSATAAGAKAFKDLYSWDGMKSVDTKFYDPVREAAKLAGLDIAQEAQKTAPPTPSPKPSTSP